MNACRLLLLILGVLGCESSGIPPSLPPPLISAAPIASEDAFEAASFGPAWMIHELCRQDFEGRGGFGAARSFAKYHRETMATPFEIAGRRFQSEDPKLIGLLGAGAPRLYTEVAGGMSMHLRLSLPTPLSQGTFVHRSLTRLERRALTVLESGSADVAPINDREELGFLGALRARGDCLRCHGEEGEGALLGALRYRLKDLSPAAPKD